MKTAPDYWYDADKRIPLGSRLLSRVYRWVSERRRKHYQNNIKNIYFAPVPVIVVGNINVGGTGKTPLAIALIQFLQQQGFQPALISRGYGGKAESFPQVVDRDSDPAMVGDEPLLIAKKTAVPVVVDPNRKRGIQSLLDSFSTVNVIISDDGLQHYAMGRDIEIVVVDGKRRFGNQHLLPAGPLREGISRTEQVDFVVCNGGNPSAGEVPMFLLLQNAHQLNGEESQPLSAFLDQTVHAVAGIGNPQRFFNALEQQGLKVIPHSFADHYHYTMEDCQFNDGLPVLMTEKDAVKYQQFALENVWVVPVETQLPESFYAQFLEKLTTLKRLANG